MQFSVSNTNEDDDTAPEIDTIIEDDEEYE